MDDRQPDGPRTLRLVAEALGEPVEALFAWHEGPEARAFPTITETNALLMAFMRVSSPQARRRIIGAVEAAARRDAAGS